jgi:hypothetical protein
MSEREQPDPGEGWLRVVIGDVIKYGDEFSPNDGINWMACKSPGDTVTTAHLPIRRRIPIDAPQPDLVNAPPHYRQGDIECIDAIRSALTPEEFRGFCKGNVIKYTWRERHKAGDADLSKAVDYLNYTKTKEVTE